MDTLIIVSDCTDAAYAELCCTLFEQARMAGTELQIAPLVPVFPLSVLHSAFLIRLLADSAPPGSIIFAVVNPVRKECSRIVGRTSHKRLTFIGRDTGQFSWLLRDFGCEEVIELEQSYVPFGGKNFYPKVIGNILKGAPLAELGVRRLSTSIEELSIPSGSIVHIDNFGILKIKENEGWENRLGLREGSHVTVNSTAGDRFEAIFTHRLMSLDDGQWVIFRGSSLFGLPEIGRVRTNGAASLKCGIGDRVTISE
jgi:S-adenosylmethionine hydrolase